jgi:hypothetical protein
MHRIKNKIEIKGIVSAVPVDMMMTFNLLFRSISLFLSTYVGYIGGNQIQQETLVLGPFVYLH